MSKKLDELKADIKETEARLLKLEDAYEGEEDERKAVVLDNRMSRTEAKLSKLIDKADALREKEGNEPEEKEEKEEIEDEDIVCGICGSDLYEVEGEEGVLWCEKCNEYWEEEDE